jgi:hypothetical protein
LQRWRTIQLASSQLPFFLSMQMSFLAFTADCLPDGQDHGRFASPPLHGGAEENTWKR